MCRLSSVPHVAKASCSHVGRARAAARRASGREGGRARPRMRRATPSDASTRRRSSSDVNHLSRSASL
eukprot:1090317-Prymnesium_polylepis.1